MRAVAVLICACVLTAGCGSISPTSPSALASPAAVATSADATTAALGGRNESACWGEATEALARLGEMGEHASSQSNPRLGLRNVARVLYEAGLLPDDSLQSLGAFLSSALNLSIDSCL